MGKDLNVRRRNARELAVVPQESTLVLLPLGEEQETASTPQLASLGLGSNALCEKRDGARAGAGRVLQDDLVRVGRVEDPGTGLQEGREGGVGLAQVVELELVL